MQSATVNDFALGLKEIGQLCNECNLPNLLVVEPDLIDFSSLLDRELVAFSLALDLLFLRIRQRVVFSRHHRLYSDLKANAKQAGELIYKERVKRGVFFPSKAIH